MFDTTHRTRFRQGAERPFTAISYVILVAPALGSRSCSELRGESCTAGDIEHVSLPQRLLWGGPIDTSRPGGRTRGSAPTSTMGRAYRHIATRRADTWVRPYVYYGAGLQTHRDPAGGHVGPPLRQLWGRPTDASRPGGRTRGSAPTPIMLMIAEQLPARAALDPDRGHRYSGPQIHRTQGGGEIP